jgi:hypothetical protein
MSRVALARVAWLTFGHALVIALFWGLVNVPDSNALMLGVSIATLTLLIVAIAVVNGTAAAWLLPGRTWRQAFQAGVGSVAAVVAAALLLFAFWWTGDVFHRWFTGHRGEVDAWIIATFDDTKTTWIDRVVSVLLFLWTGVVGVSLAVAVLYAKLERGMGAVARGEWLRAGLSRDQLMLTAVAMTLLVALPWQAAFWRPRGLPLTWWQPAFATLKLSLMFVAMNTGWLFVLLAGARNADSADSTR